jgi:hypothetical protein
MLTNCLATCVERLHGAALLALVLFASTSSSAQEKGVPRGNYPCEHADLIDITSFCDSVFGQTGLVRSDKEVPWFSQRFSTLSPKGQLQPS